MIANWVWLALLAPFFYAVSILADQYLARRFFADSMGAFFVAAGATCLPFGFGLWALYPGVFSISLGDALLLILAAWIFTLAVWPYVLALKRDDAGVATPVFQSVPFLVALGGWLILGESLGMQQIFGGAIIVLAAIGIVWDCDLRRFKWITLALMLVSSILMAVYLLSLRLMALNHHWSVMSFWLIIGWVLMAVFIYAASRPARQSITKAFKQSAVKVTIASFIQEGADLFAVMALSAAFALAPAAASVSFILGTQPLFILALGGLAATALPGTYEPIKLNRHLSLKVASISIMMAGLWIFLSV